MIDSKTEPIHFVDWSEKEKAAEGWKAIPFEELRFWANSSWYKVGQDIRYIYREGNEFELSDIPFYPIPEKILGLCSEARTFQYIADELRTEQLKLAELKEILSELITVQLLFTDWHPNIIGKDYFSRVGHKVKEYSKSYTISTVPLKSGVFNSHITKEFDRLNPLLQSIMPVSGESKDLDNFKVRFEKKYDRQAIPIMMALDPEIGIGYGNLETSQDTAGFITDIEAAKQQGIQSETNAQQLLKKELLKWGGVHDIIRLEDLPIDKAILPKPLPNTMSGLVSIAEDQVIVEHLGGATANALLGRFTLGNDELLHTCIELAWIEQEANPNVLFFDIGYTGEVSVDNVNRREQIYSYSLCIQNYDTSAEPLSLTDLYLMVQGGELVLFSKKHQKRLIPRISTAYNYTRSDLSLFRLLCDMQHQGIQTSLIPDLEGAAPGLKHYPRLVYRNIILSLAKWRLEYKEEFQDLVIFSRYLEGLGLPQHIKVGFADQTLVLNLHDRFEVYTLQAILKKNKELWVKETIVPKKCLVSDEQGNGYASEFVLSFVHGQEVYKGIKIPGLSETLGVRRVFEPGSEWLYYQIFVHPGRTKDLLSVLYEEVTRPHDQALLTYFFIRYNDGGEHLRIRLKLRDRKYMAPIMEAMQVGLSAFINSGIISDVKICTYERELERYGADYIEQVEAHFGIDSQYALACLIHGYDQETVYGFTIKLMIKVAEQLYSSIEIERLFNGLSRMHNDEHRMDGTLFKKLNKGFRDIREKIEEDLSPEISELFHALLISFADTIRPKSPERQTQLFGDLFHMHINRLFATHQRVHEMVIYNYLVKTISFNKKKVVTTVDLNM